MASIELTDAQELIYEIHSLLMDQGYSPGEAFVVLSGERVPEGLRSDAPELEKALTGEFVAFLTTMDH